MEACIGIFYTVSKIAFPIQIHITLKLNSFLQCSVRKQKKRNQNADRNPSLAARDACDKLVCADGEELYARNYDAVQPDGSQTNLDEA